MSATRSRVWLNLVRNNLVLLFTCSGTVPVFIDPVVSMTKAMSTSLRTACAFASTSNEPTSNTRMNVVGTVARAEASRTTLPSSKTMLGSLKIALEPMYPTG